MSGELHLQDRKLKEVEKQLLFFLLNQACIKIKSDLENVLVRDMNDGGMGSIYFVPRAGSNRTKSLGEALVEAEYIDEDGVPVSIVVNLDDDGELYELDFWKVDFSPLLQYPKPNQVKIKHL